MRNRLIASALALLTAFTLPGGEARAAAGEVDGAVAANLAGLALDCLHREYPNKIAHVLQGDGDVRPPRELTPAFYGCYDWHSAVHGHWLLVRLARTQPAEEFAASARAAVAKSLEPAKIAAEAEYLSGEGRVSFERPYGLAWLLQLTGELREWDDPEADAWARQLAPLEKVAADRIREWLPKLTHPIRVGEHSQTAFAFGLILDWARIAGDPDMEDLLAGRVRDFYLSDRDCPLAYEPSGQDFLSPCLAEADLMRRVLDAMPFASWLTGFLPGIPIDGFGAWIEPAVVTDPTDPKLAHLDGLNLSRAWMIEGIASGLPEEDPRRDALEATGLRHRQAGLASVTGEHYEGGHWLGSFATYLVTRRGIE
ncbi:MAG: DUF2891 domain-containing protein [bacterium]|nr:DUF2891 domain-containing protein [bacterium]